MSPLIDESLAKKIAQFAEPETTGEWPAGRLNAVREAGLFRWGMPVEFGGLVVETPQMLAGYIELSRLCLTTAFILTQRDAACHRLANSPNALIRQTLLPEHCSGQSLATVGISHLSTSRQHWSRPSVAATETPDGYEITGEAPWVTGGRQADLLVTGATLENGEQILAAVPTKRTGVVVGPALKLMALNESYTGSVMLDRVQISREEIVLGPMPHVMKVGATGGTGSFTTTAVAIGAATRTLQEFECESTSRPELADVIQQLTDQLSMLRTDLMTAASTSMAADQLKTTAEDLRLRANSLVTRTAQAYVCSAKGAGFVQGHPAERYLRQSMFFQVWSCPPVVTQARLSELKRSPAS